MNYVGRTGPQNNRHTVSKDQVIDAALRDFQNLAVDLLGDPSSRKGAQWRWGGRGSLLVHVSGPKAGQWHDFEAGSGGSVLDFWAVHGLNLDNAGSDFPRVIETLAARLGISGQESSAQIAAREARATAREAAARQDADAEAAAKARVVEAVRGVSVSANGTAGATYLQSRGVTAKPPFRSVQFHGANRLGQMKGLSTPESAALIFYATDSQGDITGGQRVLVDTDGRKLNADVTKPMFGNMGESAVRLPAQDDGGGTLYVCEGPETALTIWQATDCEVWAVLGAGRFKSVQLPEGRKVIMCPDQDAPDSPAAKTFSEALDHHHSAGVDLWIAHAPETEGSKADLNDTLQRAGIEAVRSALNGAIRFEPAPCPAPQAFPPVESATRIFTTAREFVEWMGARLPPDPEHHQGTALLIAPDHDTAAALHDAYKSEVWVLGDIDADLAGEPPRRMIFAMPDTDTPARHNLQAIAARWDDLGAHVWTCEAPESGAVRDEVSALLRAAVPWDGPAPVDLKRDTTRDAPEPNIEPDEPQEDIRERESQRLHETLSDWVETQCNQARARPILAARYDEIEDGLDLKLSDRERASAKVSAQRHARREVQAQLGLPDLPSTRRKKADDTATAPTPGKSNDKIAITGSQGIGKTSVLVGGHGTQGALHKATGAVTLMVFPTIEKAREAKDDYVRSAPQDVPHPTPVLLLGRNQPDLASEDGRALCWMPQTAEAAAKRGSNVRRGLCMGCPFADRCGYLKQETQIEEAARAENGAVIFATHAYLTLPLPTGIKPDLLICDEAPSGLAESVQVTQDDLSADLHPPALHTLGRTDTARADKEADLRKGIADVVRPICEAIAATSTSPETMLAQLREREITADLLGEGISVLAEIASGSAIISQSGMSGQTPEDIDSALCEAISAQPEPVTDKLRVLFQAIRVEIGAQHAKPIGLVWGNAALSVWYQEDLQHPDLPFAYLDGTANMEIARAQFGNLVEYRFQVPRLANVTQINSRTFSDSSITGDKRTGRWAQESEGLRDSIRDLIASKPGCFVAGTKGVLQSLNLADMDCQKRNFGALRGVDQFKGCDAAIIIGRSRPGPVAIEDMARPYAARLGHEINPASDYVRFKEVIKDNQGVLHSIDVERHPDPFVDTFRQQLCEAEIEQAVDRLRLIHAVSIRDVYLLNAYPTLTPDRVLTWDDLKSGGSVSERIIQNYSFLPASGREAARVMPDIFADEAAFRRWSKTKESASDCIRDSLCNVTHFLSDAEMLLSEAFTVTYRRKPSDGHRRPRKQTAYVWTSDPNEARSIIEANTGPLAAFEMDVPKASVEDADTEINVQVPEILAQIFVMSTEIAQKWRGPGRVIELPRSVHSPPRGRRWISEQLHLTGSI